MQRLLHVLAERRGIALAALALLLVLGVLGDIASPMLPLIPILALTSAIAWGAGLLLSRRRPGLGWPGDLLALSAFLLGGFGTLAVLQLLSGHPRGLLAQRFDVPAALQDVLMEPPPPTPRETAELRAALAVPDAPLRPRPVTADEYLYNALLLRARDEPMRAALALAAALRRAPDPRPDALILHRELLGAGIRGVEEALAEMPPGLAPLARDHLAALRLPPAGRAAALAALTEAHPDWLLGPVEFARATLAAAPEGGPTVATARRVAAALDAFANPDLAEPFIARFLDPAGAVRFAAGLAEFAPLREVAARRLSAAALAPLPGMPDAPILVRVTPPEPARSVQFLRGQDAEGEIWAEVPQRSDDTREAARDPVPTLRMTRPHRSQDMRFRYIDRDGVTSEPVSWRFDPVLAMREAAQRAVQRRGPFSNYQPGRVAPGRLNALPIAVQFRPGLTAIEWFTDAERAVRVARIGVADEAVLAGNAGRATVEFAVPASAQSLFLAAVYADGTRSPLTEMPIR